MILFVFEGRKTEPALFKTLEHLYFNNPNEKKVCCFGYNIYELYRLMTESDFTEDIVCLKILFILCVMICVKIEGFSKTISL